MLAQAPTRVLAYFRYYSIPLLVRGTRKKMLAEMRKHPG